MFMPQTKPISPELFGVNSTTTGSLRGNARRIFKDGKTTSVRARLVRCADERDSRDLTARTVNFAGSNPVQ
jgi:hypothetical protein